MATLSHLIPEVIEIARSSGRLILDIYEKGIFEEFTKSDSTPVTSADLAAHKYVTEQLAKLTPDIPVLSEEDAKVSLAERSQWDRYWLVDPLDGTQEFIARSGDFATIIALVENNQPVMGVVYAPIANLTYFAYQGEGAWKVENNERLPIGIHKHLESDENISIAVSRRQKLSTITERMDSSWHYDFTPLGSAALKACLVAEGAVDCYLRIGPTGEWDTAATQCIVEEAGGKILNTQLQPLTYNEEESLENPNFIVLGDQDLPWNKILK